MTFVDRLRELRRMAEVLPDECSQRALSLAAGLHVSAVGKIESRGSSPAASTVSALAAVFGVSLDWLIDGRGERPNKARVRRSFVAARNLRAGTGLL